MASAPTSTWSNAWSGCYAPPGLPVRPRWGLRVWGPARLRKSGRSDGRAGGRNRTGSAGSRCRGSSSPAQQPLGGLRYALRASTWGGVGAARGGDGLSFHTMPSRARLSSINALSGGIGLVMISFAHRAYLRFCGMPPQRPRPRRAATSSTQVPQTAGMFKPERRLAATGCCEAPRRMSWTHPNTLMTRKHICQRLRIQRGVEPGPELVQGRRRYPLLHSIGQSAEPTCQ